MPESQKKSKQELKDELLHILLSNVNIKGIAFDLIDDVLEEALQKVVEDTSNTLDDALMASVYPVLEKEMKQLIESKLKDLLK